MAYTLITRHLQVIDSESLARTEIPLLLHNRPGIVNRLTTPQGDETPPLR